MQAQSYPLNTGPLALLSEEEKKKRLNAMVKIWQSDTERRFGKEDLDAFIASVGLDEYRYSVWLRFPEWERSAVVGQVIALRSILLKDSCQRPLDAASESVTAQVGQAEHFQGNESATQALSLRQLNGMPEKAVESPKEPTLLSSWRRDPLLKVMPDWKEHLPKETVFNISVRITPGGLGEGSKWAIVMPKDMIPRYRPGWPTQKEWVAWTHSFDWLSIGVGFIRSMLDA